MQPKPIVTISYCPKCGWLLRSSWLSQELLTTFSDELGGVLLQPSPTPGTFQISVADTSLWCRKRDGGFPQAAELKRRVRNHVAPTRELGHSEAARAPGTPPMASEPNPDGDDPAAAESSAPSE